MAQTVIDMGIEDKLLELIEKIAKLARIIGYEEALTFQVSSKTIKESIELADKLFKD